MGTTARRTSGIAAIVVRSLLALLVGAGACSSCSGPTRSAGEGAHGAREAARGKRDDGPRSTDQRGAGEDDGIFVSPSGSDRTGKGTPEAPYKTIGRALEAAQPGDSIILRAGTYKETVRIEKEKISIRSKSDEWAVIRQPVTDTKAELVVRFDVKSSGSKLQRVEVVGGYYYGIKFDSRWDWGEADRSGASNILIEDCKIHDTGHDAVKVTPNCNNITFRRVEIYNTGKSPGKSGSCEGIDNVNGDGMVVQDSYIHDVDSCGVYCKGGATRCLIERNTIARCALAGVLVGFDTSPEFFDLTANPGYYENIDSIVRNNIIIDTAYAGIGIYAAKNAQVYNNTLVNVARKDHAAIYFGVTFQDWDRKARRPPSVNPILINNVVVQDAGIRTPFIDIRHANELGGLSALSGMPKMDGNVFFKKGGRPTFSDGRPGSKKERMSFAAWKAHIGGEARGFVKDPLLDARYHLQAGSPCIDAGVTIRSVATDIDREPRQAPYDIGADEKH